MSDLNINVMGKEVINVLWIDDEHNDQSSFVYPIIQEAKIKYGFHIKSYSNWEEAKLELDLHFEKYSAIILDAFCKVSTNSVATYDFLYDALSEMWTLFADHSEHIPWYVLSMGSTVEKFDDTIKHIIKFRKNREEDWGIMTYMKSRTVSDKEKEEGKGTIDMLFENIKKVAPQRKVTRILNRHKETFRYVGKGKLIDGYIRDEEVSNVLLKMLTKVYFPEENEGYQINETDMRKIVECIFDVAQKYGKLPSKHNENKEFATLYDATRYMAGIHSDGYDDSPYDENDAIFPSSTGFVLQNLISFLHVRSHFKKKKKVRKKGDKYFSEVGSEELLIANVLNLCYIIRCFGKYFDKHPNENECKPHSQGLKVLGKIEL